MYTIGKILNWSIINSSFPMWPSNMLLTIPIPSIILSIFTNA